MTARSLAMTAFGTLLLAGAAPALAFNCYQVVDRKDQVVYQSVRSPVDLSAAGVSARDALRAKGDQLIAMNARSCPEVDTSNIGGDHKPATVDEIVAGMRPALRYGRPDAVDTTERPAGGGFDLPRITPPVATGGGISTSGIPSGMSLR